MSSQLVNIKLNNFIPALPHAYQLCVYFGNLPGQIVEHRGNVLNVKTPEHPPGKVKVNIVV